MDGVFGTDKRVAVGGRAHDRLGRDIGAGAQAVFNIEWLAEPLRQPLTNQVRDWNRSATNIPSACRIANIDPNDAMILPHDANPNRLTFSERTGGATTNQSVIAPRLAVDTSLMYLASTPVV